MKLHIPRSASMTLRVLRAGLIFGLVGAASSFATVNASQFGVRVVDLDGLPVAGASVCVGLPGNYKQFGAVFTDVDGQATTEVPNVPFVVTISKTRFSGVRLSEPARGFNLIKQITLAEGTPGPRCKAGSTLAESIHSSVHVSTVEIESSDQSTRLYPVVTGEPTEYRLSATPEMDFSQWSRFNDTITLTGALAQNEVVYLQLRRFSGIDTAWLEARSEPVTVYLPVPGT